MDYYYAQLFNLLNQIQWLKMKKKKGKIRTCWTHRYHNHYIPDKRNKKPRHKIDYRE